MKKTKHSKQTEVNSVIINYSGENETEISIELNNSLTSFFFGGGQEIT